jgi:hypothetical protein
VSGCGFCGENVWSESGGAVSVSVSVIEIAKTIVKRRSGGDGVCDGDVAEAPRTCD